MRPDRKQVKGRHQRPFFHFTLWFSIAGNFFLPPRSLYRRHPEAVADD